MLTLIRKLKYDILTMSAYFNLKQLLFLHSGLKYEVKIWLKYAHKSTSHGCGEGALCRIHGHAATHDPRAHSTRQLKQICIRSLPALSKPLAPPTSAQPSRSKFVTLGGRCCRCSGNLDVNQSPIKHSHDNAQRRDAIRYFIIPWRFSRATMVNS